MAQTPRTEAASRLEGKMFRAPPLICSRHSLCVALLFAWHCRARGRCRAPACVGGDRPAPNLVSLLYCALSVVNLASMTMTLSLCGAAVSRALYEKVDRARTRCFSSSSLALRLPDRRPSDPGSPRHTQRTDASEERSNRHRVLFSPVPYANGSGAGPGVACACLTPLPWPEAACAGGCCGIVTRRGPQVHVR